MSHRIFFALAIMVNMSALFYGDIWPNHDSWALSAGLMGLAYFSK